MYFVRNFKINDDVEVVMDTGNEVFAKGYIIDIDTNYDGEKNSLYTVKLTKIIDKKRLLIYYSEEEIDRGFIHCNNFELIY